MADEHRVSVGRLAQLARASRLHREGRGFEPLIAHFFQKTCERFVCRSFFAPASLRRLRPNGALPLFGSRVNRCQMFKDEAKNDS